MSNTCQACGSELNEGGAMCPQCLRDVAQDTTTFTAVTCAKGDSISESEISGLVEGPYSLVIVKGPGVGEKFIIEPTRFTIGRDVKSGIFLNDQTVSREHAILHHVGSDVTIRDAQSLNGTYVNGICVDEAQLANGDEIQIGTFSLKFSHRG